MYLINVSQHPLPESPDGMTAIMLRETKHNANRATVTIIQKFLSWRILKYSNKGMVRTVRPKNSWMKNVTTWKKRKINQYHAILQSCGSIHYINDCAQISN